MTDNQINKLERAQVQLALQVEGGDRQLYGNPPTAEELAAMAESRLDDTRRVQVMSYLANDPQYYRQWITLVESIQDETLSVTEQSPQIKPVGAMQRVTDWLSNNFGKAAFASGTGAFAVAAAVILMLQPSADLNQGVGTAYDRWGSQWDSVPEPTLGQRGAKLVFGEKSAESKALSGGIATGLAALGPTFSINGVSEDEVTLSSVETGLDENTFEVFHESGRIAAISHFRCQQTTDPEFYTHVNGLLDKVGSKLQTVSGAQSTALGDVLQAKGDAKQRVCQFAEVAIVQANKRQ